MPGFVASHDRNAGKDQDPAPRRPSSRRFP
jgi:hypothetical protein